MGLTKQQINLLRYLRDNKTRPCFGSITVINSKLNISPISMLFDDVEFLAKEKLIVIITRDGGHPDTIDILPDGSLRADELSWREAIIRSVKLNIIPVLLAVLAIFVAIYFGLKNK